MDRPRHRRTPQREAHPLAADWRASAWLLVRFDPHPKSLDKQLDEEEARIRRARRDADGARAAPHLQDLAACLQKTLAQYQQEDGRTTQE
ncbi:hypothetical protein [Streptomyces sp. V4I8]|uniref:hypothetical protein n=1 Tax=Streptomyces sp. V4I8 TaxID=3156469 RepID=UPI0035186A6C